MPAHKPLIFDEFDGIARCQFPDFLDIEHLNIGPIGIVEINNGIITPTKTHTGAIAGIIPPTNQIRIINAGIEGSILVLRCQTATLMDNTGNLRLRSNFAMDHPDDTLVLLRSKNDTWLELARSNNT